jgi:hypothetical protein
MIDLDEIRYTFSSHDYDCRVNLRFVKIDRVKALLRSRTEIKYCSHFLHFLSISIKFGKGNVKKKITL